MSDNYHQGRANIEGHPKYVGPDNINGGAHWKYPQENVRPCPGLLPPDECVLDIGHAGNCYGRISGTGLKQ